LMDMADVGAAHELIQSGRSVGKIMLRTPVADQEVIRRCYPTETLNAIEDAIETGLGPTSAVDFADNSVIVSEAAEVIREGIKAQAEDTGDHGDGNVEALTPEQQ